MASDISPGIAFRVLKRAHDAPETQRPETSMLSGAFLGRIDDRVPLLTLGFSAPQLRLTLSSTVVRPLILVGGAFSPPAPLRNACNAAGRMAALRSACDFQSSRQNYLLSQRGIRVAAACLATCPETGDGGTSPRPTLRALHPRSTPCERVPRLRQRLWRVANCASSHQDSPVDISGLRRPPAWSKGVESRCSRSSCLSRCWDRCGMCCAQAGSGRVRALRSWSVRVEPMLGAKHVLALSSGTAALQLALKLANVGPAHVVVSTPAHLRRE